MATFLDVGLLEFFLPVFTFIFVFAILYAILDKTKLFGENKTIMMGASVAVAFITLFTGTASNLINFITPWFVVMFVFLLLFFAVLMFLGIKEQEIWSKLGGVTTILIFALIILIVAIGQVMGPVFSPYDQGDDGKSIGGETLRTIFHPRVLGAVFIMIIAAFTVQQLGAISKKS